MRTFEIESLPFGLDLLMNEYMKLSLKKSWGSVKVVPLYSETAFDLLIKSIDSSDLEIKCDKVAEMESHSLFSCSALRRVKSSGVESLITGNFYALQKKPFLYLITGERNPFFPKSP